MIHLPTVLSLWSRYVDSIRTEKSIKIWIHLNLPLPSMNRNRLVTVSYKKSYLEFKIFNWIIHQIDDYRNKLDQIIDLKLCVKKLNLCLPHSMCIWGISSYSADICILIRIRFSYDYEYVGINFKYSNNSIWSCSCRGTQEDSF